MDMWTTQERCPHADSLNNKYEKIESAKCYQRREFPLKSALAHSVDHHAAAVTVRNRERHRIR
jgi:hypothetical protein